MQSLRPFECKGVLRHAVTPPSLSANRHRISVHWRLKFPHMNPRREAHEVAKEPALETAISSGHQGAARLGFWTAQVLAVATAVTFVLGITTPPRSGPFCQLNCISYPFTDAVQFVPRDYLWVLPATLLIPLFVILTCCMNSCVQKRHLGLLCTCFAAMSAVIIVTDYFVQLQVVEPSLVRAETLGLTLFSQYNPHGLFIALEDLGYLMLSLAFSVRGTRIAEDQSSRACSPLDSFHFIPPRVLCVHWNLVAFRS